MLLWPEQLHETLAGRTGKGNCSSTRIEGKRNEWVNGLYPATYTTIVLHFQYTALPLQSTHYGKYNYNHWVQSIGHGWKNFSHGCSERMMPKVLISIEIDFKLVSCLHGPLRAFPLILWLFFFYPLQSDRANPNSLFLPGGCASCAGGSGRWKMKHFICSWFYACS